MIREKENFVMKKKKNKEGNIHDINLISLIIFLIMIFLTSFVGETHAVLGITKNLFELKKTCIFYRRKTFFNFISQYKIYVHKFNSIIFLRNRLIILFH
jgi:hypothetical protein